MYVYMYVFVYIYNAHTLSLSLSLAHTHSHTYAHTHTLAHTHSSERIRRSGVEGTKMAQATAINSSLTVLGKVIKALGEGSAHTPYRDTTLTMLLRSSFSGRFCTAVVVNVSSEAEYVDETLCALQFGARLAVVSTSATVVRGSDAAEEQADLETRRAHIHAEILRLQQCGHGGRFGEGVGQSEQKSFLDNQRRFHKETLKASDSRQQLAEVTAATSHRDAGAASHIASNVASNMASNLASTTASNMADMAIAREPAESSSAQAANLRDIILRQKSIKGFYYPLSHAYLHLEAELKQITASLAMMGFVSK